MPRMSPLSPTYEPQPPSIPYPCVNFLPFLNYLLTTLTTVACTIQLVWSKLLFFLQIIILSFTFLQYLSPYHPHTEEQKRVNMDIC